MRAANRPIVSGPCCTSNRPVRKRKTIWLMVLCSSCLTGVAAGAVEFVDFLVSVQRVSARALCKVLPGRQDLLGVKSCPAGRTYLGLILTPAVFSLSIAVACDASFSVESSKYNRRNGANRRSDFASASHASASGPKSVIGLPLSIKKLGFKVRINSILFTPQPFRLIESRPFS